MPDLATIAARHNNALVRTEQRLSVGVQGYLPPHNFTIRPQFCPITVQSWLVFTMPVLTSSLNTILAHLQKYRPKTAALLQPGLTLEQIQEQVGELLFCLPQEVYELYQWRNGVTTQECETITGPMYFLPHLWFLSLEEAVIQCREIEEFRQEYTDKQEVENSHRPWFPIFTQDDLECLIVFGDEELQESSPVLYCWLGRGELPKRKYSSLAELLAVVAEAYETGAYYTDFSFNPEDYPDGYLLKMTERSLKLNIGSVRSNSTLNWNEDRY